MLMSSTIVCQKNAVDAAYRHRYIDRALVGRCYHYWSGLIFCRCSGVHFGIIMVELGWRDGRWWR